MIKAIISGTLGRDAEVKTVGEKSVINFSVAVNSNYKDANGQKTEKTEWVKAAIWKNEGQSIKISEYLKKGKTVLLEGIPRADSYKNKDGETKTQLSINVKEISFLN